ncbi:gem-associated protein 5-like [Menidia menidia]
MYPTTPPIPTCTHNSSNPHMHPTCTPHVPHNSSNPHMYPTTHPSNPHNSSNPHMYPKAPPERPPVVTEPFRRLCGHTAKVTAAAWSPHHSARLVTASYDGTAQVWDVLEEAAVSNYRGHSGYLLSVDWSPVDPDRVWTGGRDFTVQEWSVSGQEFTKPPKGKKMAMLQEKKKSGGSKQKAKNRPGSKVNGEKPREASEDEGGASPEPPAASFEKVKAPPAGKVQKDKPDGNLQKKKKPRSMLPLSTSMDHRPKEDLLQDCVTLATVTHGHAVPEGCIPGRGDYVHLGLFSDRPALLRMFQAEEAAHVEAGHFESVVYLRLWSGDLQGALELATERGELNDHLLSIAPMAGFQAWRRASEAFSRQLLLQDQPLKAASHLLSLHRLQDAVELLRAHRLHREAVALVRARMPEDTDLLRELHTDWAAHLERDGHLSAAAKSYLAAGSGFEAAKVIARKSDAASLRAASRLAAVAGETPLADSLALRCAKGLSAAGDWEAAQEALRGQEGLLVHRLVLCVAELLGAMLDDQPAVSRHAWAAPAAILDQAAILDRAPVDAILDGAAPAAAILDRAAQGQMDAILDRAPAAAILDRAAAPAAILDRAAAVWQQEFGVGRSSEGRFHPEALLQQLPAEGPPPSTSTPLTQVLLGCAPPLAGALLGGLLGDDGRLLVGVWRAVRRLQESGLLQEAERLLGMLFPRADWTFCSRPLDLSVAVETAGALQACVCYHRLYACWWGGPGRPVSPAPSSVSPAPSSFSPAPPDFDPAPLLSARHAALQQTQSAIRNLQLKLNHLLLMHRGGRGQDQDQEKDQDQDQDRDKVQRSDSLQDQVQDKDPDQEQSSNSPQGGKDQDRDQDQDLVWDKDQDQVQGKDQDQDRDMVQRSDSLQDQDQDKDQFLDQSSDSLAQGPKGGQDQVQNRVRGRGQVQGKDQGLDQVQVQVQDQDKDQDQDQVQVHSSDNAKDQVQNQIQDKDQVQDQRSYKPQGPQEEGDLDQSSDNLIPGRQNQDQDQDQDQDSSSNSLFQGGQNQDQVQDQVQDPSSDSPVQVGKNQDQDQSSDQPETLLSLSAQMSRYQEELAQFPESVKMFPRPDVMECCLVLLHLDQSLGCVPNAVRRKAEDLLRKYGSSPAVLRARRRLLTGP